MFDSGSKVEQKGLCPVCRQEKQGTKTVEAVGVGWCSSKRKVKVAVCVNPKCPMDKN